MPKIDKSKYTKEEYKKLKQASRVKNKDINILCVKHGVKYSAEYVNILYSMCKRHCSLDFNFYCLTDDAKGLDKNILVKMLPNNLAGWWSKMYMFSNKLDIKGEILYMDLDVVIANNIDKLFTFADDNWAIIRDFLRNQNKTWQKYNSSVIKFTSGDLDKMWQDFTIGQADIQRRFRGDQDYIFYWAQKNKKATLFPDEWIQSWKWEIRSSRQWADGGKVGNRTFKTIENVVPPKDCCITVFHGDPNPSNCKDPFVVDNWR